MLDKHRKSRNYEGVYSELKRYLLKLVKKGEYTSGQLLEKALSKGYGAAEIKAALRELEDAELVNDLRYAKLFIQAYGNDHGNSWLRAKLIQKKIPPSLVEQILNQRLEALSEEMILLLKRKYHVDNWATLDGELKTKIVHYLARRGYQNPMGLIQSLAQH